MPAQVLESTQSFVRSGMELQKALDKAVKFHENVKNKCLSAISDTLMSKTTSGKAEEVAALSAGLIPSLLMNTGLSSDTLYIKVNAEKAAEAHQEMIDLSCIAKNLSSESFYKLSLEEAKRYRLV